jgi:hypothetical protein
MEARWRVEFTGVELASDAKLTAPVEKGVARPVEKAAAGPRAGEACNERDASGEGGRRVVVLWREGDAGRQSEGVMERETRWRAPSPRQRNEPWSRELSWRCGEVSFFISFSFF